MAMLKGHGVDWTHDTEGVSYVRYYRLVDSPWEQLYRLGFKSIGRNWQQKIWLGAEVCVNLQKRLPHLIIW